MAARYCNVFRHRPSGREEKRLLNRARTCEFCPEPLDGDRALFAAYTGFTDFELVPAHRGCGEAMPAKIDARRQQEEAERATWSARYAAEMRARSRLIVVEAALPSLVIPDGASPLLGALFGASADRPSTRPPYTHVHGLPETEEEMAAGQTSPAYTITRDGQ